MKEKKIKQHARTKEESDALRVLAYDFLLLRSIGPTGEKVLKERGYSSTAKKAFITKHSVGHDYFIQLRNRKDFKDEFFSHVTLEKAEDLGFLIDAVIKKDPVKAMQIIFPNQVNKLLVTKNLNLNQSAEEDDPEFRNAFFGVPFKNKQSE